MEGEAILAVIAIYMATTIAASYHYFRSYCVSKTTTDCLPCLPIPVCQFVGLSVRPSAFTDYLLPIITIYSFSVLYIQLK